MAFKIRKVQEEIREEIVQRDLEKYRNMALELGATDARIITAEDVIFDERVRMKCIIPRCYEYGTNANCPPYTPDVDQMRRAVRRYRYAIFFMLKVPSEEIVGPHHLPPKKVNEIASKIESAAFYDGYYLASGFGGSCREALCQGAECSALKIGSGCRNPFNSRMGMESAGMDAYMMATKMGWDIYPAGLNTKPEDLPHGTRLGLVLIC